MKKKIIVAGGGLVTNEKDELLLIFRNGFWDLPKGKLDKGETIEACAAREVEEETGVKNIELRELVGITNHEYFDEWKQRQVIKETHWFAMHTSGQQILTPQTEENITEIKWVAVEDMATYLQNTHVNIAAIIHKFYELRV